MVAQAYNPSTQVAEAGDGKLRANLGYIVSLRLAWKLCLKIKNT
jgi:hypothetical protein